MGTRMDEDAADGPGRPRIDWDALTPAVERVGPDAEPDGDGAPSSDSATDTDDGETPFDGNYDSHEDALATAIQRAAEASESVDDPDEVTVDDSEATTAEDDTESDAEPVGDTADSADGDTDTTDTSDDTASDTTDDTASDTTANDDTDEELADHQAAADVIQSDQESWRPDEAADSATDPEAAADAADGETADEAPEDAAADEADEWADLTPAVERVAPTPAIERVAPVPAITRVEEEEYEPEIEEADPETDFTNPAADIGQVSNDISETGAMGGQQGPPDDMEQPLAVHIEEMVKRLGIVVAVAGAVSLALFPLTGAVIDFLWYSILPGADVAAPHVYHPLEFKLTQLKTASLGGLIIALPVFVYQTYRFMRPGLYPHERRYYLASVPTSLILGLLGVTFAYFVVLPAVMSYFLYYSQDVVAIAFALGATFDLILLLMGYLAVVFQIPLFVMLAIMMGLTTREWLEGRRLIFWGAFLGVSFLFSPDPTGMAPVLVAATMVVLFEGTLLLLRWTGR